MKYSADHDASLSLTCRALTLTCRAERGYVVAVLAGDLGTASAPALREQLISLLRPAATRLILDLSAVEHADASGLAVLVGSGRRAGLRGGSLRLAAPSPEVARVLSATGIDRHLDIFPPCGPRSLTSSPALLTIGLGPLPGGAGCVCACLGPRPPSRTWPSTARPGECATPPPARQGPVHPRLRRRAADLPRRGEHAVRAPARPCASPPAPCAAGPLRPAVARCTSCAARHSVSII